MQLQSVCILGRQPALGLAELESLYGAAHITTVAPQVAGLDVAADKVDFNRLGGSIRLAQVLTVLPASNWQKIAPALPDIVCELAESVPTGKIQLGLSAFGLSLSPAKLNAAGLTLKKTLRAHSGRSVRIIPNSETYLNTAQVLHNHLTGKNGIELVLIASDDGQTIIARTTDVQDITSYTRRDRGRPKRDARVGMLPPKLAQIIINLATGSTTPGDKTILDPFCGTGVVLQEAMLMGFHVYGTDLEKRMIDYSYTNLQWLRDTLHVSQPTALLKPGDATSHIWGERVDFVASETYLGRPFTSAPSPEVLTKTVSECNAILKKFLQNVHGQLQPGARLCLAVPAWQTSSSQFKHLPLIDQIEDLGYNRLSFEHTRSEDLLYYRADQIVARQLLVLQVKQD